MVFVCGSLLFASSAKASTVSLTTPGTYHFPNADTGTAGVTTGSVSVDMLGGGGGGAGDVNDSSTTNGNPTIISYGGVTRATANGGYAGGENDGNGGNGGSSTYGSGFSLILQTPGTAGDGNGGDGCGPRFAGSPNGGQGEGDDSCNYYDGGSGGGGGEITGTYSVTFDSLHQLTITVGGGGSAGHDDGNGNNDQQPGGNGSIIITYTAGGGDTTPPSTISNLAAPSSTSSSVNLTWTAPGDDGTTGTATTYDIRYSTSTITTGNWASATQVTGEPSPQVAGSAESMTITGLSPGATYYFAMETADEVPNWSGLSNVASIATTAASTPMVRLYNNVRFFYNTRVMR